MKPTVIYDVKKFNGVQIGIGALIYPKNHPSKLVSNENYVYTSNVITHDKESGIFETMNTKYIPNNLEY